MRRKGQTGYLVTTVILLTLWACFFGCGGDKDKSFEKVKQGGVIKIASGPDYPPFTYYNAKKELAGFDVVLSREVAKRLGVKAQVVAIPWERIIDGLKAGEYDAILGSMSVTPERAKLVDFSQPYYYARSQAMVPKGSPIKNVKDLANKTVGVMGHTTFEDDARALGITKIRRYETNDDAVAALARKEVDAIITDDVVGTYAERKSGIDIEPIGNTLNTDKIAVAVRKGDAALLKRINTVIEEMQKDGTLRELVEKMASDKLEGR